MPPRRVDRSRGQKWEIHKATIKRLYMTENRKATDVQRIMRMTHGFKATLNQYQGAFNRWGFIKNTPSITWEGIIPQVLAIQLAGKMPRVVINGQEKPHKVVQRATARYLKGKPRDINRVTLPPLPPGVTVQPIAPPPLPFIVAELPFQFFERHIHNTLRLDLQRNLPEGQSYTPTNRFIDYSSDAKYQDMEQALLAVVPYETIHIEPLHSSSESQSVQLFASPLHRSIIWSIANNFAGIESLTKEKIFEYLRSQRTDEMFKLILSAQHLYTTQALTLNLFNAAIEVGDDQVLKFVLSNPKLNMQTNKTLLVNGVVYKPLLRAAELGHEAAMKVLLKYGADAKDTMAGHTPDSERFGVLDFLVKAPEWQWTADLELFGLLLKSGARPNTSTFRSFFSRFNYRRHNRHDLLLMIVQHCGPHSWSYWNKSGTILCMMKTLERNILNQIFGVMVENNVDLNFIVRCVDSTKEPATMIDAVALRGEFPLLHKLCKAGAEPTADTLSFAITSGREDLVSFLLKYPGRFRGMPHRQLTPLAAAIRNKNEKILNLVRFDERLMDSEKGLGFQTTLLAAAYYGNLPWVEILLEVHDSIDSEQLGEALGYAAAGNKPDVALKLLLARADVDVQTPERGFDGGSLVPPLHHALYHANHTLVRALLNADADINYEIGENDEISLADLAIVLAARSEDKQLIEMVINAGGNANPRYRFWGPLVVAIENRDVDTFERLINYGCTINEGNSQAYDETVLSTAVQTHDIDLVRYVLDHGADPNDLNALTYAAKHMMDNVFDLILERHRQRYRKGRPWGADVLWNAINSGYYGQFQKMLEFGGNPSHYKELDVGEDCEGMDSEFDYMTPFGLSIAMSKKTGLKYVQRLLMNKPNRNCQPETIVADTTSHGRNNPVSRSTAFLVAIETGYRPVIDLLLRARANVNFPAELGVKRTPLQKAAELGNVEIVQLLLDEGANVNAPASAGGGGTALQLAAVSGSFPLVKLLLDSGAEVNADPSDVNGRTALEGAAEHARLDVLNLLLSALAATGQKGTQLTARARSLAEKNGRHYIVESLDRFDRDGSISSCSIVPTQNGNNLNIAAAQASSYNEDTTCDSSEDQAISMTDDDNYLDRGSGLFDFDAYINSEAMET